MRLYVEPDELGYKAWENFRRYYKIFYGEWNPDYVAEKLAEYGAEAKVWHPRLYPQIKFPSKEMAMFFLLKWS
jgi:hypothetical protein